ncbi:hypothetical protein T4B_10416 [Trichinella pseudospiralis]|uniref:Uncharacterized protein n=2 Tax=Trichinella pseudospiralis TaxID=6337 RepID=A0A0V1F7W7_TRIPS|nr:hypothetical protein T4D_773 [Trichinella pseudospiralis]KRZ20855.1 hypothetical protein T4B_10416 [Trichinella pseudospiralis]
MLSGYDDNLACSKLNSLITSDLLKTLPNVQQTTLRGAFPLTGRFMTTRFSYVLNFDQHQRNNISIINNEMFRTTPETN